MTRISRDLIISEITAVFAEDGVAFNTEMLEKRVMELGVDSMTYAILVARLERLTGLDPFTANSDLAYPETLEDFVKSYA